jgi:hypothetical protein
VQVETIRERLEAEFSALEAANVHAILDSAALVPKVVSKVDGAAFSLWRWCFTSVQCDDLQILLW